MILHASARMDERMVQRTIKAGRTWKNIVTEMPDHELVGLYIVAESELEKRGLLDRPGRASSIRT